MESIKIQVKEGFLPVKKDGIRQGEIVEIAPRVYRFVSGIFKQNLKISTYEKLLAFRVKGFAKLEEIKPVEKPEAKDSSKGDKK